MGPIYNRIHLGLGISPELPPQNDSVANSLFWGPIFGPKKVPGPKCRPGDPKSDPGLQNLPLGMKKQKMRAEKPCRTPSSELQTEPYGPSYGQKPFSSPTPKKCGSFWEAFGSPKSSKLMLKGSLQGFSERVCEKKRKRVHI